MKTRSVIAGLIFAFFMLKPFIVNAQQNEYIPSKGRLGHSLALTIEDAVLMALDRNQEFNIKILGPKIKEIDVQEKKEKFDINFYIDFDIEEKEYHEDQEENQYYEIGELLELDLNLPEDTEAKEHIKKGSLNFSKLFSYGTEIKLGLEGHYSEIETNRFWENSTNINSEDYNSESHRYITSGEIKVTQPLLNGFGKKVNLSLVKQSELDRQISVYELRQYVIELISGVQKNYWELILAEKTFIIRKKSLELANKQLAETEERIKVGKQSESELIVAQAEVAAEKRKVIDAKSSMAQTKLDFLLLLNPEIDIIWDQPIELLTLPTPIKVDIKNIQNQIADAFQHRPDLNQAYLNLHKGELEVVRTKNGVLPKLDFFISLKQTASTSEFPSTFDEFDNSNYSAGFSLSRPIGNLKGKSQYEKAHLQRQKYQESIKHLKQMIQVEVRKAILEIECYQEQIKASQVNQKKQEEKLKVEQEKFRLGRSTNLLVFQAQRDLIEAEVNVVTSILNQIKATIDLQATKGTILKEWSINVMPSS